MEIFKIVILSLSGLMLFLVGTMRLIKPIKSYCFKYYLEHYGNKVEDDTDLLNEVRGVGSVTLIGGIIILLGTVIPGLMVTSFAVAIMIFLGFAIGRLLSMALDGKPNKDLVQGTIAEIAFSVFNIFGLVTLL